MSTNTQELVYSQEDMADVLKKLSAAKREAELSHQLLWAVVQSAGGHVKVHYSLWVGEPVREIEMWDDPSTYELNLRVRWGIREVRDV